MPFKIVRNDLTRMQVDVIVNTANPKPKFSSGVDTAVYKAAGEEQLLEERKKIGFLEEGEVAITPGFKLPAKYIIHAVSPRYHDGKSGEEQKLRKCYQNSLKLAAEYRSESIAFPLIATGNFRYPKEEGIRIALDEISSFLLRHEMMVYLVVFDSESTNLSRHLYPDLEEYIDRNYESLKHAEEYGIQKHEAELVSDQEKESAPISPMVSAAGCIPSFIGRKGLGGGVSKPKKKKVLVYESARESSKVIEDGYDEFIESKESALEERMKHLSDTFQEYLMYLIQKKKLTNSEVYKRAVVTKQVFSKIKTNPEYHPDKATAMRLCIGACLNLDETKDLLARAGYALSPCDKRDIIFSYFIEHHIFDMIEIDITLEEHDLPCFIE